MRENAGFIESLLNPFTPSIEWPYPGLTTVAISRSGRLVYYAFQDGASLGTSGMAIIALDSAGVAIHLTDPRASVYRNAVSPSINDLDEVVFIDTIRRGLFNGPDPAFNRVIGSGSSLPGYSDAWATTRSGSSSEPYDKMAGVRQPGDTE